MRHQLVLGVLGAAIALVGASGGDAKACGGCFHTPEQIPTVVTDHRMIFAISQQQTTLYDQIKYSGSPKDFAWVLPIHGTVSVGLSADTLFDVLDQMTHLTILPPPAPSCPFCGCGGDFAAGAASNSGSSGSSSGGGVSVLAQEVVGPYQTVQLQSTDPNALNAWLIANQYVIPANVMPIIAAYVNEGFNFLALRLTPGAGVAAMRPVSVTTAGAGLSLPLRMVAAGTGATVGITLWVVGDGRYEPKNFLTFLVSPSDLTWNFNTAESDYTTVRSQKEMKLGNAVWQVESSLSISPYDVESAVLNGGVVTGGPGFGGSSSGVTNVTSASDYAAVAPIDAGADGAPGSPGESADQVRQQDLATLFASGPSTVRITRLSGDLSQAALANDLVLQAAGDQSVLSNTLQLTKSINAPVCQPIDPSTCPCGITNGSSSGSSGGTAGGSSDGGVAQDNLGGNKGSSSGCAMGPGHSTGSETELALAGLVGLALVRARKKRS
jgi:hypothetical protein